MSGHSTLSSVAVEEAVRVVEGWEVSRERNLYWDLYKGFLGTAFTKTNVVLMSTDYKHVTEHYPVSKQHCGARENQVENPYSRKIVILTSLLINF
jgi:hypothetical protein